MHHDQYAQLMRMTPKEVAALLDRVDLESSPVVKEQRRANDRVRYRMIELPVSIAHPHGGSSKFFVMSRNLSCGGLSFIHRRFLYNGARIHALLATIDGEELAVPGSVVYCRHIDGNMHEVGVCFDNDIDLSQFAKPKGADPFHQSSSGEPIAQLHGMVLCFTEQEDESRLLKHHLNALGLQPVMTEKVSDVAFQVANHLFNTVIADLDSYEGMEAVDAAIEAGHKGSILILAAEEDSALCVLDSVAAINHSILIKPSTIARLSVALEELLPYDSDAFTQPYFSEYQDENGMAELIVQYIDHVNQTARQLKEAVDADQLDQARIACQMLKGTASGYGFPQLTVAALDAVRAMDAAESVKSASDKLERVLAIAARLRAS